MEGKLAKLPPQKRAKTVTMAKTTVPSSTFATEEEGTTPQDTPPSALTPSMSVQLVTTAGDSPTVTPFQIQENLAPQCKNLPEGEKTCVTGRAVDLRTETLM